MTNFSLWALLWRHIQLSGWLLFSKLGIELNHLTSTLRLLKHAIELKKPVVLLNVGPTRADDLPGLVKLDVRSGAILGDVTRAVMYGFKSTLYYLIECSFIFF